MTLYLESNHPGDLEIVMKANSFEHKLTLRILHSVTSEYSIDVEILGVPALAHMQAILRSTDWINDMVWCADGDRLEICKHLGIRYITIHGKAQFGENASLVVALILSKEQEEALLKQLEMLLPRPGEMVDPTARRIDDEHAAERARQRNAGLRTS